MKRSITLLGLQQKKVLNGIMHTFATQTDIEMIPHAFVKKKILLNKVYFTPHYFVAILIYSHLDYFLG
jgi:hypothetical protein